MNSSLIDPTNEKLICRDERETMKSETTARMPDAERLRSDAADVLPLRFQDETTDRTWASAMNYTFTVEKREGRWCWSAWDRSLTSCTINPCESKESGIAICNEVWVNLISGYLVSR